ncbi:unnamed protein product [Orchesella dallaii]|uniref:Uncharacterized protein n=1 Tax=Orchesella dallaii TaxID=48710 RepID=A0ABP1R670_9HEXA
MASGFVSPPAELAEHWQVDSAPSLQNLTTRTNTADGDMTQYEYVATFITKFPSSLFTLCVNAKLFELESLSIRDVADRDFDDEFHAKDPNEEPVAGGDWE